MGIVLWFKELRPGRRGSFSASLENRDFDLRYHARFRYRWRLNPASEMLPPISPDALARYVLRELASAQAIKYRAFDYGRAEDAINAALCDEVSDDENRILVMGYVNLRIPRRGRAILKSRMGAEVAIQSAFAKENVQLELLLRRLTDPAIGPMWWMQRYADIQFAVGDPKPKVKSMLEAFAELRRALEVAKVDKIDDLRLQARHKLDEVFAAIEDPQSFTLVIELMNRFLDEMGVQKSK